MQGQSIISPNLRHTTRDKSISPRPKRVVTIKKDGTRKMFAIIQGITLMISGSVISKVGG